MLGNLPTINWKTFISFEPCYVDSVVEYAERKTRWHAFDVSYSEQFPIEDRLWLMLRPELIPPRCLDWIGIDFLDYFCNRMHRTLGQNLQRYYSRRKQWLRGEIADSTMDRVKLPSEFLRLSKNVSASDFMTRLAWRALVPDIVMRHLSSHDPRFSMFRMMYRNIVAASIEQDCMNIVRDRILKFLLGIKT